MRFIAKQRSRCARCLTVIVERKRKPCPKCGWMNRIIDRSLTDEMPIADKA